MVRRPRLLLICPAFFGYDKVIAEAAKDIGFEVLTLDARAATSALYKSALKAAPGATRRFTQSGFQRFFAELPDPHTLDRILVIRGDGLTLDSLKMLRSIAPNARMTYYLWDSARNVPGICPYVALADEAFTFDLHDSKAFGWTHLPLFSQMKPEMPRAVVEGVVWDWSFIGSLHSDRHRILRQLLESNPTKTSFVHCYVQNRWILGVRAIYDPGLLTGRPPKLSMTPLPYPDYINVTTKSRAVLDIEHPSQTGLTMRSIETLLSGKKLITTNQAILDSDLYDPSRTLIIDRHPQHIPDDFLLAPTLPIPEEISEKYRINNWLARLLAWDGSASAASVSHH